MRSSRAKMRIRPISNSAPMPIVRTDLFADEDSEREDLSTVYQQQHAAAVAIPIPPINFDAGYYRRYSYAPYHPPLHYIKFHQASTASLYSAYDRYDLKHEDCEWLHGYNAEATRLYGHSAHTLTEDAMERMIELMEKEAGALTLRGDSMAMEDKIDVSKVYTLAKAMMACALSLSIKGKSVEAVYHYWIDKRRRLGKALIRIFQEPPPKGNTDPHVAFRPRTEGRRISKRNPRKDDITAYQKMLVLKKDFARVVELVESQSQREAMKLDSLLLDAQIFDAKLAQSIQAQKLLEEAKSSKYSKMEIEEKKEMVEEKSETPAPLTSEPDLPPALASLLRSTLPSSTWVRAEKKPKVKKAAKIQQATGLPPVVPPSTIKSTKSGRMSKSSALVDARSMKKESASTLPQPLSFQSPSLPSSRASDLLGYESPVTSDEDVWMSEDEDEVLYYHDIETYLHKQRSTRPPAVRVEYAFPEWNPLPPLELVQKPPGVSQVLGQCRPRIGRQGLLWVDPVLYIQQQPMPPPVQRAVTTGASPFSSLMPAQPPQMVHHPSHPMPSIEAVSQATSFSPYPATSQPTPSSLPNHSAQPREHAPTQSMTPQELAEARHGIMRMPVDPALPVK